MTTYEDILDYAVGDYYGSACDEIAEHLTKVGEVDLAEPCYDFNLLAFWVRKRDGQLLYATDSGCSCPSPFQDTQVRDLKETNLAGVLDVAHREVSEYGYSSAEVVQSVRELIPAMREAGAR